MSFMLKMSKRIEKPASEPISKVCQVTLEHPCSSQDSVDM